VDSIFWRGFQNKLKKLTLVDARTEKLYDKI
jgi:hypothetical protein